MMTNIKTTFVETLTLTGTSKNSITYARFWVPKLNIETKRSLDVHVVYYIDLDIILVISIKELLYLYLLVIRIDSRVGNFCGNLKKLCTLKQLQLVFFF
jgi:hypothetical protein